MQPSVQEMLPLVTVVLLSTFCGCVKFFLQKTDNFVLTKPPRCPRKEKEESMSIIYKQWLSLGHSTESGL